MHAKGKRISLSEVEHAVDSGNLLSEIEKLGFNNYEFIDEKSKNEHYKVLKSIVSDIEVLENEVTTLREDCGLLYVAFKILNRSSSDMYY